MIAVACNGWQGQSVGSVALRTPEECLEAWRYIRPYAEGVQGDRRALTRLQGARIYIPALHDRAIPDVHPAVALLYSTRQGQETRTQGMSKSFAQGGHVDM